MKNKRRKKVLHKKKMAIKKAKKASRSEKPKEIIIIDEENTMSDKITVEELGENVANILAGIIAQNGFRKAYVESVVRRLVTDTALADSVVAELNTGFDKGDTAFDTAAKAEAEEIDLPPSDDAGDLVKDLFA